MNVVRLAIAFCLLVPGCAMHPGMSPLPTGRWHDLTLEVVPPARSRTVQAVRHRWVATDIHQYEVTLKRWGPDGYADLVPPLTVVLPQTSETASQARFTALKSGYRYQAVLVARGNAGGTAPDQVLNSQTPTTAEFDFSGEQDIEAARAGTLQVTLDSVPFSGTVSLLPSGAPEGTTDYVATLSDEATGATVTSIRYARTQALTLEHLKAGVRYSVSLAAYADTSLLATAPAVAVFYDASGQDLEENQTVTVTF